MKLTDGSKTVKITMRTWDGMNLGSDWSFDFFEAGSLPYDAETDAYTVQDVDYCIGQAKDWRDGTGDFYDDESPRGSKLVLVDEL